MVIKKTFRFNFTYYYFSIPERLESSTWEKNNRTSCCHHDYVKNTRHPLAEFQTKCFIHEITQSQPSRPPISKFPRQGNDKLNVIILVTEFCSGGGKIDLRLYYTFLLLGRKKKGGYLSIRLSMCLLVRCVILVVACFDAPRSCGEELWYWMKWAYKFVFYTSSHVPNDNNVPPCLCYC